MKPKGMIGVIAFVLTILLVNGGGGGESDTMFFRTDYASRIPGTLIRQVDEYLARYRKNTGSFNREGTVLPIGSFRATDDSKIGKTNEERRAKIRAAVKHAWDGYEADAWGYDELRPVTGKGVNSFAAGMGTTIVDSLSTLYLMGGLDGRYERGRDWVVNSLDFSQVGQVIVFETVIRVLGGLISMYHLSGEIIYAERAEELGARIASSFESPTGYPWPRAHLNDSKRRAGHDRLGDTAYLAEVGSVQLEIRALAHLSKEGIIGMLRERAENIIEKLQTANSDTARLPKKYEALLPFSISIETGKYSTNMVTLGAPADSYFEYLVKCWVQGGKKERKYWELFEQVMEGITELGIYESRFGDLIVRDIIAEENLRHVKFQHKMDHFACYIPGMIVLGIDELPLNDYDRRSKWWQIAERLTETCYKMYKRSPIGLAGENIRLSEDDKWRMNGAYNLRPEAVEAFFYMWRFTKRQKYRDYAWEVFQSIERHCKLEKGGYAAIKNARSRFVHKIDIMHSFLIAETFKYLYLIFGPDDELPLDKWVFNTEAHPLLITPELSKAKVAQQSARNSDFDANIDNRGTASSREDIQHIEL